MGFGSVVDKEVTIALVFEDLFEFLADLLPHGMEDFWFLGFLSEELEDLHESIDKFFKKLNLMFIRSFVVVVPVEDVFFEVGAFVVDGIETGEVIAVFLDLFEALLDGEGEVLDDGGDVFLAQGHFGLCLLLAGLHLGEWVTLNWEVKLMIEILFSLLINYIAYWGVYHWFLIFNQIY